MNDDGRAFDGGGTSAVLSVAFRPFFLLGAAWSVLALGIWIAAYLGGASLAGPLAPLDWHIYAIPFGFALAAITGFILTLGRALNLTTVPIGLVAAVNVR